MFNFLKRTLLRIGDRAIMTDVGKHCVIGAGSVVTKPIPDYAIAIGSPARVVRFRTPNEPSAPATLSQLGLMSESEPDRMTAAVSGPEHEAL